MKASKKTTLTRLFALVMLIGYAINGKAQAFDGDDDCKLHAGYINFGKQNGGEIGIDYGLSDYLSYGVAMRVVEPYVDEDGDKNLLNGTDAAVNLRYHFQETLELRQELDFFVGTQVGLSGNLGLNVGVCYNFGEVVGVYARAERNLFEAWHLGLKDTTSPFKNNWGFSVGLTFNIDFNSIR